MFKDTLENRPTTIFYLNRFLVLVVFYSLVALFIISQITNLFETELRTNYSDAIFSLINLFCAILFISFSLSFSKQQLNMAFFWIFQYIFFGLGGLIIQIDPFPYYLAQTSTLSYLQEASRITFVAQISVGIGQIFSLIKQYKPHYESDTKISGENLFILRRIKYLITLYVLITPFTIIGLGGIDYLLKRVRFDNNEQGLPISISAILQTLLYVPPLVSLVTLLYFPNIRKNHRLALVVIFIWILLLSNPFGNARQVTLFLIFPLLFIYLRGRIKQTLVFFAGFPFLFLYSAGLINRYTGQLQTPRLSIISRDGDFDSFSQVANGLQAIDYGNFPLFRQITGSLLFFLPRSLYQNKPNDTGIELARSMGLKFQNLSAPWLLEAYANARLVGVIFVGVGMGFFLANIDLNSALNLKSFLLSSMTSGFLFILLRGSLLQATGRAAFTYILIFWLIRTPLNRRKSFTSRY
jgi:hypothetical protein